MFSLQISVICIVHRSYSKVRFTLKTCYLFTVISTATTLNVKESLRSVSYFFFLHTLIMQMQPQECKVARPEDNLQFPCDKRALRVVTTLLVPNELQVVLLF
jgi:hypothetical protein